MGKTRSGSTRRKKNQFAHRGGSTAVSLSNGHLTRSPASKKRAHRLARTNRTPAQPKVTVKTEEDVHMDSVNEVTDVDLPFIPRQGTEYLNPEQVLGLVPYLLSDHETREILLHPEIWYLGPEAVDKVYEGPVNFGFDTETGWYQHRVGDHIQYRYEVVQMLGKGMMSTVHKAYDYKERKFVALKCAKNQVTETTDINLLAEKEIKILRYAREMDPTGRSHVVPLLDDFVFRQHRFLVFDVMKHNLYGYAKTKPKRQLPLSEIRVIAKGLFSCLKFLQDNSIIHLDIKPENVMIQGNDLNSLVVIDFGTSTFVRDRDKGIDYCQSRDYRAPEVIAGLEFGMPVDTWSAGCVIAELLIGEPLLHGVDPPPPDYMDELTEEEEIRLRAAGEDDQFAAIIEMFGHFPQTMVNEMKQEVYDRFYRMDERGNTYYRYLQQDQQPRGDAGSKSLVDLLGNFTGSWDFIEFVKACLQMDPTLRMTPAAALQHKFLI